MDTHPISLTSDCKHAAPGGVESHLFDSALLDVVPPFRFAMVEEGLYRGAYPTLRNFPFLRTLGLRTIVLLTPEEPTYDLSCFAAAENITLRYIRVGRYKGEVHLLPTDMNEALQLLINAELHPLYVHCLDGRHVVGLVIMGLRKLQLWEVGCSHLEYKRFTRGAHDEVAFIADYSGPIVVPRQIPEWLWKGSWCDATGKPKRLHVGIRLKFPFFSRDAENIGSSGKGQPSGRRVESSLPGGCGAGDILFEFLSSSPQVTDKREASPMHTVIVEPGAAGGNEREATYVDLLSIAPARLVESVDGLRQTKCVVHTERPVTADVRFLSLRTSAANMGRWSVDCEAKTSLVAAQIPSAVERPVPPHYEQVCHVVAEVAGCPSFTKPNSSTKKTRRRRSL